MISGDTVDDKPTESKKPSKVDVEIPCVDNKKTKYWHESTILEFASGNAD